MSYGVVFGDFKFGFDCGKDLAYKIPGFWFLGRELVIVGWYLDWEVGLGFLICLVAAWDLNL
jgi:hypothetical protein